jgi:hypothetical protein
VNTTDTDLQNWPPAHIQGSQILKPKILIWVIFGGICNGSGWYIVWPFGLFYGNLVYFEAIWYILRLFGIFCRHLIYFVAIWYILHMFIWYTWFIAPRKIWQPWSHFASAVFSRAFVRAASTPVFTRTRVATAANASRPTAGRSATATTSTSAESFARKVRSLVLAGTTGAKGQCHS